MVKITISDNGQGMNQETQAKTFDPFFTTFWRSASAPARKLAVRGRATKPVGKGTGLGLSTSYQIIVGEHGGTISCSSELLRGSKFTITLPVAPLKFSPEAETVS